MFQIKSVHLKLNRQSGLNRDLNPYCNWDLFTTACHTCSLLNRSRQVKDHVLQIYKDGTSSHQLYVNANNTRP